MADSTLGVNVIGRDDLTPLLNNLESRIIRFVGFVSSAIAGVKVAAFPVSATADFQRELANVQKTTNFLDDQMRGLAGSLKELSLRMNVSVVDLTKIAAAAGQQGLGGAGVAGVVKFTESVARMASVLDISAEDAGTNIGKLLNIFHLSVNETEKISSAFNEVSNNSTASGAQLLDIVRRIGDAAGTINLQKSLGLAATGIDLGLSPEVVGTSFQSIFIQMRSKASQFSKLLGVDVKTWMDTLKNDGITALTQYLSALRKLDSQSQAETINKLSGQGRIAGLMNKLIQDTTNSVLNKNLGNADAGFGSGTSALKEQQRVLGTFNEQAKILKNSIFTLATETGDQLVPQLTAYTAKLSEALQAPGLKSFMQAIGQSFLDLVKSIASVTSWVAGLNINWENFIGTAKVLVSLRLVEMFGGLATRLPGVSALFATMATSANAAAGAMGQAATAQVNGLTRMTTAVREYAAARAQQAAADDAAARAQRVAQSREADYLRQARVDVAANRLAQTAGANTAAAATNNANVRAQAAAAEANVVNTLAQRRAQAEAASQAQITQIQANYRGQRRVAQIAARDAEIAQEEAALRRRLAGYDGYYNRLLAQTQASNLQLIAAAEANELRLTQVQQTAEQQRLASARGASVRRIQMEESDGAVRAAQARARAAAAATEEARARVFNLGAVLGAVAAGLGRLLSLASGVVLWGTLIYTALDALGIVDKLGPMFQNFTDKLGLTSAKSREAAEKTKLLNEELEKQKNHVAALAAEYDKLKDKQTGGLSTAGVKALQGNLTSQNFEQRQRAVGDLGGALVASDNEVATAKKPIPSAQFTKLKKDLDEATASYKKLNDAFRDNQTIEGKRVYSGEVRAAKDKVDELTKAYAQAQQTAENFSKTTAASGAVVAEQAAQRQKELAEQVAGLFTDKSADLFQQFVVPISNAQKAVDVLNKSRSDLMQKQITLTDPADIKKSNATLDQLNLDIAAAQKNLTDLQNKFKETQATLLGDKNLPQADTNAIFGLNSFSGQTNEFITAFQKTLAQQRAAGAKLTGSLNAKVDDTKPDGDGKFETNTESEARKMAKVQYELAKAKNDALAQLEREKNDQIQRINQEAYDRGMLDMRTFYEERKRLQLKSNADEIKALQADAGEARRQRDARKADGAKPSELAGFDVNIARLNGQIAVLKEKQKGIRADAERDLSNAQKAFEASISSAQLNLASTLGVENFDEFFGQTLEAAHQQNADFWAKIVQEGGEGSSELVNKLQQAAKLEALAKVFDKIGESIQRSYSSLDLWIGRLGTLQERGEITTAQYEKQAQRYRAKAAEMIASDIAVQQAQLQALTDAGDQQTQKYKDLNLQLDQNKLRLEQLRAQGNQVAREINQSIQQGIQAALNSLLDGRQAQQLSSIQQQVLEDNASSVRRLEDNLAFLQRARDGVIGGYSADNANIDAQIAKTKGQIEDMRKQSAAIRNETTESFLDMILRTTKTLAISVATTIRDAATKNLSEMALKSVSGMFGGGQGIGGMIANALGGGGQLGSSVMNPMWIKDADAAAGDAKDAVKSTLGDTFDAAKEKLSSLFDDITGSMGDMLGSLSDNLGGILDSLGSSLSDVFSSIFSSGGGGGGWGAAIASFFHSGGVVGSTYDMRPVNGMFAHATRYHTGGIAGLAPNEVPAILQKGEEVLTKSDPRHKDNGGTSDGGNINVEVNVNMETGNATVTSNAQDAREFGRRVSLAVQQEIITQKRPGGLLNNG